MYSAGIIAVVPAWAFGGSGLFRSAIVFGFCNLWLGGSIKWTLGAVSRLIGHYIIKSTVSFVKVTICKAQNFDPETLGLCPFTTNMT